MPNLEGEWLARNAERAYPFNDADDRSLSLSQLVGDTIFLDAFVVFAERSDQEYVRVVSANTTTNRVTVKFSASDEILCTDNYSATTSDDGNYNTIRVDNESEKVSVTLILAAGHPTSVVFNNPPRLVSRCAEPYAKRVDNLYVAGGGARVFLVDSSGSVRTGKLVEGNNIKLELDPDTARIAALKLQESKLRSGVRRVVISAIPGAGEGKNDADCNSADAIYSINGQTPINGDLQLVGDSCYRVMRPPGTITADNFDSTANTLRVANDCGACCDCADFKTVYNRMRQLKEEGLAIKRQWEAARSEFNTVLSEWQAKLNCLGNDCLFQVFAYAYTGWSLTVQLWVGNPQSCLKDGGSIEVSFSGGNFDPSYIDGSGMVYTDIDQYKKLDPVESPANVFTMEDNTGIRGGSYKMFLMSVRMEDTTDRVVGANVDISVAVNACGQAQQTLNTTVQLLGTTNKT